MGCLPSSSDRVSPHKGPLALSEKAPLKRTSSLELWTGAPRVFILLRDTSSNPPWSTGWAAKMLHLGDLRPSRANWQPVMHVVPENQQFPENGRRGMRLMHVILTRQQCIIFLPTGYIEEPSLRLLCSVMEWHSCISTNCWKKSKS